MNHVLLHDVVKFYQFLMICRKSFSLYSVIFLDRPTRQRDRQTGRQTDVEIGRQTDREIGKQTDRQLEKQTDR